MNYSIAELKEVFGSLTLGGWDFSRFATNGVTFSVASDSINQLSVGTQSITSIDTSGIIKDLLPFGIVASIDSTVSYIRLPMAACQAFERAFGLVYDSHKDLYPVSDSLHDKLVAQNASITFTLGHIVPSGQTMNTNLPYTSL